MIYIERPIPNTKGRYVINTNGEVFSLWRYQNNGSKTLRHYKLVSWVATQKGQKSLKFSISYGSKSFPKTLSVIRTMGRVFNLRPPDNFHYYDLVNKDGDHLNNSLSNLEWRIRTYKGSAKYSPEVTYNEKGKITHKVCIKCGKKKEIKNFCLNNPTKKRPWRKTYKNRCYLCQSRERWEQIKSDSVLRERDQKAKHKYYTSPKGREYHREYGRRAARTMQNCNIRASLNVYRDGLKSSDITPLMVEIQRSKLKIRRYVKQSKENKHSKKQAK